MTINVVTNPGDAYKVMNGNTQIGIITLVSGEFVPSGVGAKYEYRAPAATLEGALQAFVSDGGLDDALDALDGLTI